MRCLGKWQGQTHGEAAAQHGGFQEAEVAGGWLGLHHTSSPPTLMGLHLFWYHQQEFTVLSSQMMF